MRLIRDGGDEERLADATREATRAMWQTVLLGRERRARKRLFERVLELVRARQPR